MECYFYKLLEFAASEGLGSDEMTALRTKYLSMKRVVAILRGFCGKSTCNLKEGSKCTDYEFYWTSQ